MLMIWVSSRLLYSFRGKRRTHHISKANRKIPRFTTQRAKPYQSLNTTETEVIPPPPEHPVPLSLNLNPSNPEFVNSQQSIPPPLAFSGDPLQFPIWLKAFQTLIESRTLLRQITHWRSEGTDQGIYAIRW